MTAGYDIIGDVHGQATLLRRLLSRLGYRQGAEGWRHPERTAIFVGDLVDNGREQLAAITLVRRMVDAGTALAVMGNHDLHAVAWATPDPRAPGEFLRPHLRRPLGPRNRHQHRAFLAELERKPALHQEVTGWLLTLPLWLELPGLRVVHACWHPPSIAVLHQELGPEGRLRPELLPAATQPDAPGSDRMFRAVEMTTKGPDTPLPSSTTFLDKHGLRRTNVRLRWWDPEATTYQTASKVDDTLRRQLPDTPIPAGLRIDDPSPVPLFFGHYALPLPPGPLTPTKACVDYAAGHGGPLCAYRWQGEQVLRREHFQMVRP